jgi:hypothetical protein
MRGGAILTLVGVAAALAGCSPSAPAQGPSENVTILTGMGDAVVDSITVEAGGWTYAIPTQVRWVDAAGTWHDGRPACLEPGMLSNIRFATVEVTIEGATWRPVVWVACPG